MKVRLRYRKDRGVTRLRIEGDKGDGLGYAEAQLVHQGRLASFLPLSYERKGRRYYFDYAAQGLIPLDELLRQPLVAGTFPTMLLSFLTLVRECEEGGLSRQRVSMDTHHILGTVAGELRFVYVPLQSFVSTESGLRGALAYLCEHAVVPGTETPLRDSALDYVRRTALITSTGFGGLLVELGLLEGRGSSSLLADESVWVDTDQLGERAVHGHDFVRSQLASGGAGQTIAEAPVSAAWPSGERAASWVFVRRSTGDSWQLAPGAYDVGRDEACSIVIPDVLGLSRRHALIEVGPGGCSVCDLGSTNGTRVDGVRCEPHEPRPLASGSSIILGDELFELLLV